MTRDSHTAHQRSYIREVYAYNSDAHLQVFYTHNCASRIRLEDPRTEPTVDVFVATSYELRLPTRRRDDLHEPLGYQCTLGLGHVVIESTKMDSSEGMIGEEDTRGLARIARPILKQPRNPWSHWKKPDSSLGGSKSERECGPGRYRFRYYLRS